MFRTRLENIIDMRQSDVRVGKKAQIMAQRYAHARQFKRHRKPVKFLATRLGRVIRDISRKIGGNAELETAFAGELDQAIRLYIYTVAVNRALTHVNVTEWA